MKLAPLVWLGLMGCKPPGIILQPTDLWDMFPFDGQRTWEYQSTNVDLPYKLIATSNLEPDKKGNINIYTVQYWTECVGADPECVDGEVLYQIKWSSTVTDGTQIHAYDVGNGFIELDPPLLLAPEEGMLRDDVVETETGGQLWTSTYKGIQSCPIAMTAEWDQCAVLEVVTEGDGAPIAGTYWVTRGNGTAALELAHEEGQWQLASIDCEPLEDCDGTW